MLLADGSIAVVRPLQPGDGAALHELHEQVSDEAIRMRFFSVARHAAHAYVDHVLDDPETLALVARAARPAGRARDGRADDARPAPRSPSSSPTTSAGMGVGTLLLEHLAALALARGITTLRGRRAHREPRHAAPSSPTPASPSQRTFDLGTVVLTLGTGATQESTARADDAGVPGRGASLQPMLRPSSVAVVGARSDGTGIGATVLRSIVDGGFQGRVVAVHPRAHELAGVPTYASLARRARSTLDLVVICVPAGLVLDVFRDAVAAGVRAAVIVSSGFGELGAEGARIQHDLAAARPRARHPRGRAQLPRPAVQRP